MWHVIATFTHTGEYCPYGLGKVDRSYVVTGVLDFPMDAIPKFVYYIYIYVCII
jgi:hypothetical protein